jgi:hypothetical protein
MLYRLLLPLMLALPAAALAHVKWFEDYQVEAEPVPISQTLSLPHFWLAVSLVLGFFIVTTFIERTRFGATATAGLDTATAPLRNNADRFLIAVLAAFFVALVATGNTYLTPELTTDSTLVPWLQLIIAIFILFRPTRPAAGLAIVGLWLLTLRDYDLFHLFDYLALGLGLAGYLILSGLPDSKWHNRRFAVLRWGIALALMWSSMEKFMYPQWFLPLLEEKPFLAFGIPFGPYTTMAGVAEFTLGFGILWTPLVRRLSAAALFVLMFAAVYPFGRVDLIGHATILASLLVILADPIRDDGLAVRPERRRASALVPAGLAVALAASMLSYTALHDLIYDRARGQLASVLRPASLQPAREETPATAAGFWRSQEHLHGAPTPEGPSRTMMATLETMHRDMNAAPLTGNPDRDFTALMIPHHQSAADMARVYLQHAGDPKLRRLAEQILREQTEEISQLRAIAQREERQVPSRAAGAGHDHGGTR